MGIGAIGIVVLVLVRVAVVLAAVLAAPVSLEKFADAVRQALKFRQKFRIPMVGTRLGISTRRSMRHCSLLVPNPLMDARALSTRFTDVIRLISAFVNALPENMAEKESKVYQTRILQEVRDAIWRKNECHNEGIFSSSLFRTIDALPLSLKSKRILHSVIFDMSHILVWEIVGQPNFKINLLVVQRKK